MQAQFLLTGFTAAIAAIAHLALTLPAQASETKIFCGIHNGYPTTIVSSPQYENLPIIGWTSQYFGPEYTPQTRCEIVSQRFQEFMDRGVLVNLTTGILNGYPVICATPVQGGSCDGRLLITLKRGDNSRQRLQDILNVSTGRGDTIYETGGRVYIDFQDMLLQKAADLSATPAAEVQALPTSEQDRGRSGFCPGPLCNE